MDKDFMVKFDVKFQTQTVVEGLNKFDAEYNFKDSKFQEQLKENLFNLFIENFETEINEELEEIGEEYEE